MGHRRGQPLSATLLGGAQALVGGKLPWDLASAHGYPDTATWQDSDRLLSQRTVWFAPVAMNPDDLETYVQTAALGIGEEFAPEESDWTESWARDERFAWRWQRKVALDGTSPLHVVQWKDRETATDTRVLMSTTGERVYVMCEARMHPKALPLGCTPEILGVMAMLPGFYLSGLPATTLGSYIDLECLEYLTEELAKPERTMPVVLMTLGSIDMAEGYVNRAVGASLGVAVPLVLTSEADKAFGERIPGWKTGDGKARLYMPGQVLETHTDASLPAVPEKSMDVLRWATMKVFPPLVAAVQHHVIPDELRPGIPKPVEPVPEPMPEPVDHLAEAQRSAKQHAADAEDARAWLREAQEALNDATARAEAAEAALVASQVSEAAAVQEARDERASAQLTHEAWGDNQEQLQLAQEDNRRLTDQVRFLQTELARHAVYVDPEDAPRLDRPSTFAQLLDRLDELELVDFTGSAQAATELDTHGPTLAGIAAKTWDVLLALDDYAQRKMDGLDTNLAEYLRQPPPGAFVFSANQYVPSESATVRTGSKLSAERTFEVPANIDPRGSMEMSVHVRLGSRRLLSPRLYLHDATRVDGRIYVGYIGKHLTNTRSS